MKGIIGLVILIAVSFVSAQEVTTPDFGPFDWNYFQTRVQNTLANIEIRIRTVENEFKNHPEKRIPESLEVEADLNAVIDIENMINSELKDARLTQAQKEATDGYRNKALEFRVKLNELRKKIGPQANGYYAAEDTTAPSFGPYETTVPKFGFQAFQNRVNTMILSFEKKIITINQQIRENPERRTLILSEIEGELKYIDELVNNLEIAYYGIEHNTVEKIFLKSSELTYLRLKNTLEGLKLRIESF